MTERTLFDLLAAESARDEALDQVARNAPDGWEADASAWLCAYLRVHREYVPDVANRNGPEPPERRAWGIITRRAIRAGWIVRTGFTPRTRGHATPGPVYRSLLFQGAEMSQQKG